jgi:hypothetical protein
MVLDELKQIEFEQKKFKKIAGLILAIVIIIVSIVLIIIGINHSREELILISSILLVLGILLGVLNKIGLNMLKKKGI